MKFTHKAYKKSHGRKYLILEGNKTPVEVQLTLDNHGTCIGFIMDNDELINNTQDLKTAKIISVYIPDMFQIFEINRAEGTLTSRHARFINDPNMSKKTKSQFAIQSNWESNILEICEMNDCILVQV